MTKYMFVWKKVPLVHASQSLLNQDFLVKLGLIVFACELSGIYDTDTESPLHFLFTCIV